MNRQNCFIAALILLSGACFSGIKEKNKSNAQTDAIAFIENKGQVADQNEQARPDVLFSGSTGEMVFHIRNNGVSYQLHRIDSWKHEESLPEEMRRPDNMIPDNTSIYRIDSYWKNCNSNFNVIKGEALPGYNNYYKPVCPNGVLNVGMYNGIVIKDLYNGIDLHYYSKNGSLKHDYVVAPNADYSQIRIEIKGAEVGLNNKGGILLKTSFGTVEEGAPVVFQEGKQIAAAWKIDNNVMSFSIPHYDRSKPLIIDPLVRMWGTYYGGSSVDYGQTCAVDGSGNSFHTGYTNTTFGTDIATIGSHQSSFGGSSYDAFLVKFNTSGVRQWGTYYGGTALDYGFGCAADNAGNSYITGYTGSTSNISTVGAHQTALAGGTYDGFAVKFNSAGVRQWGTYYGGTGTDYIQKCGADPSGNLYFTGYVTSTNGIATAGAQQTVFGGSSYDAILIKLNTSGVRVFGTYCGGTSLDYGMGAAGDAAGNGYISGYSASSNNISSGGSHQPTSGGGYDAFVVKYSTTGLRTWGTYYGGSSSDYGFNVYVDGSSNVYSTGYALSANNIASPGSHQPSIAGGQDGYLVKFNSAGVRQWGTYYGGTGSDWGMAVSTSSSSNVYLSGYTSSNTGTNIASFDGWAPAYLGGTYDAYLAEFTSAGVRLSGTYYGGSLLDYAYGCAASSDVKVFISGYTQSSTGLSSPGAHQVSHMGGTYDGYLAKFEECVSPPSPTNTTPPSNTMICSGQSTTLSVVGTATLNWYNSPTSTVVLGSGGTFPTGTLAAGSYSYYAGSTTCAGGPRILITVTVNPLPVISLSSGTICPNGTFNINPGGAVSYTFVPTGPIVSPTVTSSYTVTGTDSFGCVSNPGSVATVTVMPSPTITVNSGTICLGQTFTMIPSGATSYTYSSGSPTVSPVSNATYFVTGDSGGCVSQSAAMSTVGVMPVPSVSVTGPNAMCVGQTITLTAFGASTYSWSNGMPTQSIAVSPTTTTSYSVVGTSTNSCGSAPFTKIIQVNPNPNVTISPPTTVICLGESLLLTGVGADSYSWSNGALTATTNITPTTTAMYTVVGTNTATGCMGNATRTIIVSPCTGLSSVTGSPVELKLYPNPHHDEFNIESPETGVMELYNAIGQKVMKAELVQGVNTISMRNYSNGVYIARITYPGHTQSLRVIKN